ncbi:MAG TPA: AI-2E family transporter [Candidatus Paceibacterota bacterium]
MQGNKIQSYFLLVLIIGALILSYFIFKPFFQAFVLAAVFAVIFSSFHRFILRGIPKQKGMAAFISTVLIISFILVPVTFLGFQLVSESHGLYNWLQEVTVQGLIFDFRDSPASNLKILFPNIENFSADLSQYIGKGLSWLTQNLGLVFSSFSKLLFGFLVFAMSLYYLFKDGDRFRNILIMLSPLSDNDDESILAKLKLAVNSVIKGNLTIAFIQGVMTAVGFAIFGIPNFVLWGTLAGICALIPSFGTSLVLVPGIVYLFIIGSLYPAIGLLLWGILAVGLIDNFLGPKLIGKEMKTHPLIVLFSVIGGIAFFGPIGFVLGPLVVSLLFALLHIYVTSSKRSQISF